VIGSNTAHMLVRSDRPDTMTFRKVAKRKNASRFRRLSVIEKSGRSHRCRFSAPAMASSNVSGIPSWLTTISVAPFSEICVAVQAMGEIP